MRRRKVVVGAGTARHRGQRRQRWGRETVNVRAERRRSASGAGTGGRRLMALGWAEAWRRAAARGGLEAGGGLARRAGGGAAGRRAVSCW
jgi:hypothetical protein